jgi:hypothetical protein
MLQARQVPECRSAQCEWRNARIKLRKGHIANTVSRLSDVTAVLRPYWVDFRIVDDTVHLQLLIRCYAQFVTSA